MIGKLKATLKPLVPRRLVWILRAAAGIPITLWKVFRLTASSSPVMLEIGAGPHRRDGWVTLDVSLRSDLYWDLGWGLPFPRNSVQTVYSSHVLEHFDYHGIIRLLTECRRVLKPGGQISVSVPDARLFLSGYLAPDRFDRALMGYLPAVYSGLRMDILNYVAYMDGEHKYMFDAENLLHVLATAGFADAHIREFNPNLDPPAREKQSIYASATRE